jgi:hypothetical protein
MQDKIEGAAELSFAQEVLGLGGDHVKIAGTPEALQKEGTGVGCDDKKKAKGDGIKKMAEMSLRDIFQDANFRRGVMEEIDSSRHMWEPAAEAYIRASQGTE